MDEAAMNKQRKKIAAITMVRNDDFFLRKWVEYYGEHLGKENLFVCFDGEDQAIPDFCKDLNVKVFPHVEAQVQTGDKLRMQNIVATAKTLMERYDFVIGGDADEYLIPDPALGESLVQFISRIASEHSDWTNISGLGVDVGQDLSCEEGIRDSEPFLSQRHKAKLSTRYSKASVLLKPVEWGRGFHRVKGCNYHIVKDLYLFHFGCVDFSRLKAKMGDDVLLADGWSRHLNKRARTVKLCTKRKGFRWETAVPFARHIQNVVRPPYIWNKPAMFELRIVVRIPDRFRNII